MPSITTDYASLLRLLCPPVRHSRDIKSRVHHFHHLIAVIRSSGAGEQAQLLLCRSQAAELQRNIARLVLQIEDTMSGTQQAVTLMTTNNTKINFAR